MLDEIFANVIAWAETEDAVGSEVPPNINY